MSLIQTQPAPTAAQAKEMLKQQIVGGSNQLYQSLLKFVATGWTAIWENPFGLTPQQAVDALGDKAVDTFTLHAKLVAFLNDVTPGALPEKYQSAKLPYTIDASSGKITVTQ